MGEEELLLLLKFDLQRVGVDLGDDGYLCQLLQAAGANLTRQNIAEQNSADYWNLVVGTAAWMYRKRITGEAEPRYLRRLRMDLKYGRKADA